MKARICRTLPLAPKGPPTRQRYCEKDSAGAGPMLMVSDGAIGRYVATGASRAEISLSPIDRGALFRGGVLCRLCRAVAPRETDYARGGL